MLKPSWTHLNVMIAEKYNDSKKKKNNDSKKYKTNIGI